MTSFRVVVAGRPNVGKSALFNRLLRRRRSLVHDLPGMTRDVLEVEAKLPDGRSYRLLDTGGFDPEGKEKIPAAVREKAVQSIRHADLVLLVVDASAGVLPGDRATARAAREAGVETVVVANKIDRREGSEGEVEAWELGFPEVYGVSAEHGIGVDELIDAIAARMPRSPVEESAEPADEQTGRPSEIALAVVGRPNVGKSSLVNALLGEERAIVSEAPGTTRDSVDVLLKRGGKTFRLVDTAGIRRKAKTERGPEVLSVVQARKRIEECDVALLVFDAAEGPTAQDAAVASYAHESGKGLVLVANKWDIASPAFAEASGEIEAAVRERIPFAGYAELVRVSARTGRGIGRALPAAARAAVNRRRRISTGELNRVLGRRLRDAPPRTARGPRLRVYYVAQTAVAPPTFTLVCNREEPLHFSESRRIENILREAADFTGSPIRISVRGRSRERASSKSKVRSPKARGSR
ncbi:MAG TPA: ribosome biogenesis GTPase Der [Thermoanaerobaculia bacterium]